MTGRVTGRHRKCLNQRMPSRLTAVKLWNNQFPEAKILGLAVSRRMRALVYMASRDKIDVDAFHKGIQLIRTGKTREVEIWL